MAVIDIKNQIIQGKIVYYGPGLCGKTTNLEYVNSTIQTSQPMMSLATEGDRTIFFDFLPMELGKIRGISTSFKLYTVPGQVRYNLTRKMVLKNVDGVVFVADSQRPMLDSNIESLNNLYSNLNELGINPDDTPIVLQYNKRDLPNLFSPEELDAALNSKGYPTMLASAVTGEGVLATLKQISKIVFDKFSFAFGKRLEAQTPKAQTAKPAKAPVPIGPVPIAPVPIAPVPIAPVPIAGAAKTAAAPPAKAKTAKPAEVPVAPPPVDRSLDALERAIENQNAKLSQVLEQNSKILKALAAHARREEEFKKHQQKMEKSLAALESTQRNLPTGADLVDFRKEAARLLEQARSGPAAGKEIEDLRKAVSELAEQARSGPAAGKEIEDIRKAVSELAEQARSGPAAGKEIEDIRKAVSELAKQARSGPAAGKEIKDLRKAVDGLVDQTRPSVAAEKKLVQLHEDVSKLRDVLFDRIGAAVSELREDITKVAEARIPPPVEEIKTKSATDGETVAEENVVADLEPAPDEEAVADLEPSPDEEAAAEEEPPPDEKAEAEEEPPPDEKAEAEEEPPPNEEDFSEDPRHKNAARIARVMVADLALYYSDDIAEGIKTGDILERLEKQFEEMQKTFEMRVPEDVRAKKDYLKEAIDNFIEKKRKALDVE